MKDWTQEGTVSPYLMKPLRSHAEAQADIRRHDDAIAEARRCAGPRGEVVVAGSVFVLAEVRARILGLATDPPLGL